MDGTFFVVVGVVILLLLIPISRLRQLKAGGFELALDRPEVVGAIGSLNLARVEDGQLRAALKRAEPQLNGRGVEWVRLTGPEGPAYWPAARGCPMNGASSG